MQRLKDVTFTLDRTESELMVSPVIPVLRYIDIVACDWRLLFRTSPFPRLYSEFPPTDLAEITTMPDLSDVISTVNLTDSTVRRTSWADGVTACVINEKVVKSDDSAWKPDLEDMVADDWIIESSALGFVEAVRCLHRSTACNAGMRRANGSILFLDTPSEVLTSKSRFTLLYEDIIATDWQLVFY
jgi:hypothetical protein